MYYRKGLATVVGPIMLRADSEARGDFDKENPYYTT